MNDEQIRRATIQLASALIEMASERPELIHAAFEDISPEDAVRIKFQLPELRVALPARS
jgi:hypothetical protein